jgi:hypothetical protein
MRMSAGTSFTSADKNEISKRYAMLTDSRQYKMFINYSWFQGVPSVFIVFFLMFLTLTPLPLIN